MTTWNWLLRLGLMQTDILESFSDRVWLTFTLQLRYGAYMRQNKHSSAALYVLFDITLQLNMQCGGHDRRLFLSYLFSVTFRTTTEIAFAARTASAISRLSESRRSQAVTLIDELNKTNSFPTTISQYRVYKTDVDACLSMECRAAE